MSKKHSKRYCKALEGVDLERKYSLEEAAELVGNLPGAKFDETVDIAVRLGVDPRQSDQMVRGTASLPHGSGKSVYVIVFAAGAAAEAAKAAGANEVGYEDLIEKVKGGWTGFDVAVATPEAMAEVRKLGRVLGPRGLMPNPKTGTVTDDTAKAVKEVQAGRVEFKLDKAANIHVPIGKKSFDKAKLVDNARAVFDALLKAKPANSKGGYIRGCSISATMSPGLSVDLKEVIAGESA
jgi:large subunit ribosomal protein L1